MTKKPSKRKSYKVEVLKLDARANAVYSDAFGEWYVLSLPRGDEFNQPLRDSFGSGPTPASAWKDAFDNLNRKP